MKLILPITKEKAIKHFQTLSPEDIETRFCSPMPQERIESYVKKAKGNFYGIYAIGVSAPVSVLHYCPLWDANYFDRFVPSEGERIAEVAFSTSPGYQGQGNGRLLMLFARGLAEVDGVDTLIMSGLARNKPIQKLARELGFTVTSDYQEFEAELATFRSAYRKLGKSMIQLIQSPFEILSQNKE